MNFEGNEKALQRLPDLNRLKIFNQTIPYNCAKNDETSDSIEKFIDHDENFIPIDNNSKKSKKIYKSKSNVIIL